MKTTVAAGARLSGDDIEIVKALIIASNASGTVNRPSGLVFQAGVRNESGEIYRSATFNSRNQLLRLATRMGRIGYADELGGVQGPLGGFDAIYSRAAGGEADERAGMASNFAAA